VTADEVALHQTLAEHLGAWVTADQAHEMVTALEERGWRLEPLPRNGWDLLDAE